MRASQEWQALTQDGRGEVVLTWDHPEHGFPCKCKVDWLPEAHRCIVDLKTCQDASPSGFRRALTAYGYAHQASWYLQGALSNGLYSDAMVFACVESAAPYATAFYAPDSETLYRAGSNLADWARMYAIAIENDRWTGYPTGINTISALPWAFD